MPAGHRKKPFSSKQKKEQLKAKREKKRETPRDEHGNKIRRPGGEGGNDLNSLHIGEPVAIDELSKQPSDCGYDPNRYKLHFLRESDESIRQRKAESRLPLRPVPETELEVDVDAVYGAVQEEINTEVHRCVLDMPKRPPWHYDMSKHKLLQREETYFKDYMERLLSEHKEKLSYCEVNLETWRQLWRVTEMADVVLLIADVRHPALHFPPAFYDHVSREMGKPLVLILNKIDMVSAELVVAWKHYFNKRYPHLHIVCFTSFPRDTQQHDPQQVLGERRRRLRRTLTHAAGPKELHTVLQSIVQNQVDLSSWHEKIKDEAADALHSESASDETVTSHEETAENLRGDFHTHEAYKDGVLTIGCCGYPNVGKSSVINALMGKKVVSVSKTPGHTKYFQTIFLTPSVKLCDSPGLVFPSLVEKPLQILAGMYPIAQVREPYSVVGYLSRRLPVWRLLGLTHPALECKPHERPLQRDNIPWSAMHVCEAWAIKRGFLTAKAARPDVYRAANQILRLAVEGRLCLCMRPPGFTQTRDEWLRHPETQKMRIMQELIHHRSSESGTELTSESESDLELEKEEVSDSSEASDEARATGVSNPYALLDVDD